MKKIIFYLFICCIFQINAQDIAPIDQAITIAQISKEGKNHTLLVKKITKDLVYAINISKEINYYPKYSMDIFRGQKDYSYFINLLKNDELVSLFDRSTLLPAAYGKTKHIGVAGNYPEHANETNLSTTDIFIFPKLGQINGPFNNLAVKENDLMDYEVELCVSFDRDIHNLNDFNDSIVGLFLCNDWSERTSIIMKFDSRHPKLAGGLADAKSSPQQYQAGSFMVIPYNLKTFVNNVRLSLTLNGAEKQNQIASKMIFDIEKITKFTLETGAEKKWFWKDENIAILPSGYIEKGMTLLTGTPKGIIFRPPSTSFKIKYAAEYLLTGVFGPFYTTSPIDYIRKKFVRKLIKKKVFLQAGDYVESFGTYLGSIKTQIIKKNK